MFSKVLEETAQRENKGIQLAEGKLDILKEKRSVAGANEPSCQPMKLTSEAFGPNAMIPAKFTCDGVNINPSMDINSIPENAKSLAIIVDDPDGMNGNFCHWVSWNLPVTDHIDEGECRGFPGKNDFGFFRYNGPCPPVGTHRYFFKVYALDCKLNIPSCSGKTEVEKAMKGHVVGFGFLVGKYHMRN